MRPVQSTDEPGRKAAWRGDHDEDARRAIVGCTRQATRAIESGSEPKPNWITLQADCRFDKVDKVDKAERRKLLARMHPCVLRGFKANNAKIKKKKKGLDCSRRIASSGFQDYTDFGWMKSYDSPFVVATTTTFTHALHPTRREGCALRGLSAPEARPPSSHRFSRDIIAATDDDDRMSMG